MDVVVSVYSHGILVHKFSAYVQRVLEEFERGYTQWGYVRKGKRVVKEKLRVYAAIRSDMREYRFPSNVLEELLKFLGNNGVLPSRIKVEHVPMYESAKVEFISNSTKTPREDQVPIIEHLASDGPVKIAGLQTGKGKTYCFITAMRQLGVRTVLQLKPAYIEQWVNVLNEELVLKPGELLVVSGGGQLRDLLMMGVENRLGKVKIIIVSTNTMQGYIRAYEQYNTVAGLYPVSPQDFYQTLGAGLKGVDEGHEYFHFNYKARCYTHAPKELALSATLEPDDAFINRMYEILYPLECRIAGVYDKYIGVTALVYALEIGSKLRWKNRRNEYSHIEYEASILKSKKALATYCEMVVDIVGKAYMKVREPGQRCLVFVTTKEMAAAVAAKLRERYPTLRIGKYVGEDAFEDVINNDVSVTTPQSAGTGVDVPGLRIVVNTINISSKQRTEQMRGRLRRLKDWPDVTPEYYYLICENIPDHRRYHYKQQQELQNKVVSQRMLRVAFKL